MYGCKWYLMSSENFLIESDLCYDLLGSIHRLGKANWIGQRIEELDSGS